MNRIAIYTNAAGITSSIEEKGVVRIYLKNNNEWKIIDEQPCNIDFSTGLTEIKKSINDLIEKLTDCKVFVATAISGQLYYLLEAKGFNSYEAAGEPECYLDSILENEMSESCQSTIMKNEVHTSNITPEPTDQCGVYFLDLKKALATNPALSSKKILKPFLQDKKFDVLNVHCDHVPRWFETDLKSMGLNSTTNKLSENSYQISITVN